MNSFQVILTPEAKADITRLDPSVQTRLMNRLEWLGENAEFVRHQTLQGKEWVSCFKYRVGDYRVIYQLDNSGKKLIVLKVGHRREVYK